MNRAIWSTTVAAGLALLAACGGTEEPAPVADAEIVGEPATEPATGMEGMVGMDDMQQGGAAPQLQAHMQMMQDASGEELQNMLPEHRQLVANTLAQMNREMQGMAMAADSEWDQTVAALRDDLVRLPEMATAELQAFMPEHQARIARLIEMHGEMMGEMQM